MDIRQQKAGITPTVINRGPMITPFDDNNTILLKWAGYLASPIKYMYLVPGTTQKEYNSLFLFIQQHNKNGLSLDTLSKAIENASGLDPLPWLSVDILMLYIITKGKPLGELFQEVNLFQKINEDTEFMNVQSLGDVVVKWWESYNNYFSHVRDELEQIRSREDELTKLAEDPIFGSNIFLRRVTLYSNPRLRTRNGERDITVDDGQDIFNYARVNPTIPFIKYNEKFNVATVEGSLSGNTIESRSLIKLYRENELDDFGSSTRRSEVDYDSFIYPSSQSKNINMIYFRLWAGVGRFAEMTKELMFKGSYNLKTNHLEVQSPIKENYSNLDTINRITKTFPIALGVVKEREVSGDFFLYGSFQKNTGLNNPRNLGLKGFEFDNPTLLFSILNMPLVNSYLYIDETLTGYPDRKTIKIYFKSPTTIFADRDEDPEVLKEISNRLIGPVDRHFLKYQAVVTLTQIYADGTEIITITDPTPIKGNNPISRQLTLPVKHPYIRVNISKASSEEAAKKFSIVFNLLMKKYQTIRPGIANGMKNVIQSPLLEKLLKQKQKIKIVLTGKRKQEENIDILLEQGATTIDELKKIAKDIFLPNYARNNCQKPNRPIIPPRGEIENIKTQTFVFKNAKKKTMETYNRQVMEYPPLNPFGKPRDANNPIKRVYHFVCPNTKKYPFPGVKENKLANKDIYPYVPCCYGTDQMKPGNDSDYDWYYRGKKKRRSKRTKGKLKTNKILDPGREGILDDEIATIISKYDTTPDVQPGLPILAGNLKTGTFFRRGVVRSPNSLIHCVLDALDYPEYINAPDVKSKENLVVSVRKSLV